MPGENRDQPGNGAVEAATRLAGMQAWRGVQIRDADIAAPIGPSGRGMGKETLVNMVRHNLSPFARNGGVFC